MKKGQFLGALGAMMNNVENFISKDGQATGGDASPPGDQSDQSDNKQSN